MKNYKLRCFVGPVGVNEIAAAVKEAGFPAMAGTEHVHVIARGIDEDTAVWNFLTGLRASAGTTFGLDARDVRAMQANHLQAWEKGL